MEPTLRTCRRWTVSPGSPPRPSHRTWHRPMAWANFGEMMWIVYTYPPMQHRRDWSILWMCRFLYAECRKLQVSVLQLQKNLSSPSLYLAFGSYMILWGLLPAQLAKQVNLLSHLFCYRHVFYNSICKTPKPTTHKP